MKRKATVDHSVCVACGACAKVCPKGAISVWKGCYARVAEKTCVKERLIKQVLFSVQQEQSTVYY